MNQLYNFKIKKKKEKEFSKDQRNKNNFKSFRSTQNKSSIYRKFSSNFEFKNKK